LSERRRWTERKSGGLGLREWFGRGRRPPRIVGYVRESQNVAIAMRLRTQWSRTGMTTGGSEGAKSQNAPAVTCCRKTTSEIAETLGINSQEKWVFFRTSCLLALS